MRHNRTAAIRASGGAGRYAASDGRTKESRPIERIALALAAWVVATGTVCVPVLLYLHQRDERSEPVDEAEVAASRRRHPTRQRRAA